MLTKNVETAIVLPRKAKRQKLKRKQLLLFGFAGDSSQRGCDDSFSSRIKSSENVQYLYVL